MNPFCFIQGGELICAAEANAVTFVGLAGHGMFVRCRQKVSGAPFFSTDSYPSGHDVRHNIPSTSTIKNVETKNKGYFLFVSVFVNCIEVP